MSLSSEQFVVTAEVAGESYADVETAATGLNAAQESWLTDDLNAWEVIRNSYVKLKGGSDGVDFDNERKRQAIFYRVRKMLGFPFRVYSLDGSMLEFLQIETGINF